MLEIKNLSKSFKDVHAVNDLSFTIGKGEVLGLIGPNGCGKTTTIKCICSLLRPDYGTVIISGHDLAQEPVKAKEGLAYVPEIPNPYPDLTVDDQIEFAARLFEVDNWRPDADRMLIDFDLDDKRTELAKNLSKGQKQKLSIITAFIHKPDVILLDEPLIGIDPKGGKTLKDHVKLAQKRGATILISSHMLGLVEELATHLLIMHKGRTLADGSVREVKEAAHLSTDSRLEDVYIQITEGATEDAVE